MRGKIYPNSKEHKMQKLLDKEIQLEAQLQRCEDNIDLFEEYYLRNSWRTGNLFLGWPICTYTQITEFINRPRAKKNTKPYVEVSEHQKLFSLSSVSSKPFINVSKVSYLATKDLHLQSRQKIPRSGNQNKKSKLVNEKSQKIEKLEHQNEFNGKEEEDQSEDDNSQEEDNSDSEQSELGNLISQESKQEFLQDKGSQKKSEIDDQQSSSSQQMIEPQEMMKRINSEMMEGTRGKFRDKDLQRSSDQQKVNYSKMKQKQRIVAESQAKLKISQ